MGKVIEKMKVESAKSKGTGFRGLDSGRLGRCLVGMMLLVLMLLCGAASAAEQKVVYRLKWLINMSTVGDILADRMGFFAQAGLAVELKAGGPERDAIRELELGYADFGVASADQVIQAAAKGAPVVVVAQLFQVNPLQWIYFKDKVRLDSPADLKGKRIGVTFGKNDEIIMRTLLAQAGIAEDQVRLTSVRLDYTPFYKHQADFWPVYANTQGVEIGRKLIQSGEAVGFLNPGDYGVRFVANSVVTSERTMSENPELVRRFVTALLLGWRAALDPANTERAIAEVRRYDPDTAPEMLRAQLAATRPLIQPPAGAPVGRIDGAAWEQTEQIMLAHGQIPKAVHVGARLRPMIKE
jgi:NitT/TauT family transport system substrate-binding protein